MVERRWRPLILASTRAILDSVVNSAKSISAAEDDGVLRPRRSRFANEDGGSASASLRLKAGISCGACPQRRVRTTPSTHARTSSTTATPIPPPPSPTSSAAPTPTPPGFSTSTRSTNKLWRSSRRYMGAEQWRWGRASYTHGIQISDLIILMLEMPWFGLKNNGGNYGMSFTKGAAQMRSLTSCRPS
ncbi:uncharacterized protein LOC109719145 isoform X2 [Ananas comosus]|uniref:Uncharacterized protein LOC109709925 isoform X2 n=1 Tax=Ananas comosus TaxID=4615 RepID=A0A6P5G0A9_ANACO|nr:uncharacterized protein LOC109709925 isoform X2 [Ananas comosus]XP_020101267.1 uncharacterized protein LOC109719145 isoform X2 [Ananas comosus]